MKCPRCGEYFIITANLERHLRLCRGRTTPPVEDDSILPDSGDLVGSAINAVVDLIDTGVTSDPAPNYSAPNVSVPDSPPTTDSPFGGGDFGGFGSSGDW